MEVHWSCRAANLGTGPPIAVEGVVVRSLKLLAGLGVPDRKQTLAAEGRTLAASSSEASVYPSSKWE